MSDEVTIEKWFRPGNGMMYNTYALDWDHPMHPYNQILKQGKRPEDYGIENPKHAQFADKSREELIDNILSLRDEIFAREHHGHSLLK